MTLVPAAERRFHQPVFRNLGSVSRGILSVFRSIVPSFRSLDSRCRSIQWSGLSCPILAEDRLAADDGWPPRLTVGQVPPA